MADRESDSYEIISGMVANDRGFVLRLRYERNIIAGDQVTKLYEVLKQAQGVAEREATRALFAKDSTRFTRLIQDWPKDIRRSLLRLVVELSA